MDRATVELAPQLDLDAVRDCIASFAASEGGVVRLDRARRDLPGGRHFHVAAPAMATGTLEVDFQPADGGAGGLLHVVLRPHWTGTWAGGAALRLTEHLAARLGDG